MSMYSSMNLKLSWLRFKVLLIHSNKTQWYSGHAPDLYLGTTWFEAQPVGCQLFCSFLYSLEPNTGIVT
jgi:hypothetical protein